MGNIVAQSKYPVLAGSNRDARKLATMKKILLVASSFQGGGAEHVARKNLEFILREKGLQAAVLTCKPSAACQYGNVRVYQTRDFREASSPFARARDTLGIRQNAEILKRCLEEFRPDIVHLHEFIPFTPPFIKTLSDGKENGSYRVVLTHHTYSYICTNDMLYNRSLGALCEKCIGSYDTSILRNNCAGDPILSAAKFFQKNLLKKGLGQLVDLHIAPSRFLMGMLLKAFPTLQVRTVHNPCLDSISADPPGEKTGGAIYFGRISREKNLLDFTRRFISNATGQKLLIVGDGPQAGELETLLEQEKTDDVKFIHRFLTTDELTPLLRNSKFFVLPSIWYENSPVSIVEAVNAYTIPVVSDLGGMRELIDHFGVGYCFDPEDPGSIQRTLAKARDAWGDDMGRLLASRDKLGDFTVEAYAGSMKKIYEAL